MGFNTTVVVLNDALESISRDGKFGCNLVDSIMSLGRSNIVSAGEYVNAATVIETHHADLFSVVLVGRNTGSHLQGLKYPIHVSLPNPVEALKEIADQLGYRVVKKTR